MKCPVCKTINLHMSEKKGVEIDYCPECRGVWDDRGELDKIIEKSHQVTQPRNDDFNKNHVQHINEHDSHQRVPQSKQHDKKYKKKSRTNRMGDLLGDIFDF